MNDRSPSKGAPETPAKASTHSINAAAGQALSQSNVDGPATHVIDAAQNEDVIGVLTQTEATDLDDCEAVIRRGLKTFVEVGTALQKIRDGRLYRTQWATFEEYLQQRWDMRRETADRTIRSAEVAALVGNPNGLVKVNEAQARELAPLLDQPETLDRVWSETVERTGGKPTAAVIRLVRNEVTPPPPAVPPPAPRKQRRNSLPNAYRNAVFDLDKAIRRLERLHAEDRFGGNRKALSDMHWKLFSELGVRLETLATNLAPDVDDPGAPEGKSRHE